MSLSNINRAKKMKIAIYGMILQSMIKHIDEGGDFYDLDFSEIDEKDRDVYIKAMKRYDFDKKAKGIDL
jgi:hypothetical protein